MSAAVPATGEAACTAHAVHSLLPAKMQLTSCSHSQLQMMCPKDKLHVYVQLCLPLAKLPALRTDASSPLPMAMQSLKQPWPHIIHLLQDCT